VGYLLAEVVEFDKERMSKNTWYYDPNTLRSQVGKSKVAGPKAIKEEFSEKPTLIAQGSNAEKTNVDVFNNYLAAFNTHDLDKVEELLAEEHVFSYQVASKDYEGKTSAMKYHKDRLKAFDDLKLEASRSFAVGDYVVGFTLLSGTNNGAFRAMNMWKGSKNPVSLQGLDIIKVSDGKVQQHLAFANGTQLAAQLGLIEAPTPPPAPEPEPAKPDAAAPATKAPAPAAKAPAPAAKPPAPAAKAPAPATKPPATKR
jgi:predicted ester cyclase